jgi:CSLREA domain-containing protein
MVRPLLVLLVALAPALVHAQVAIAVTTTDDEFGENVKACSLREAIEVANTGAAFGGCAFGGEPVTVAVPAGVYGLSRAGADEDKDTNATGDLDVRADVTVQGADSSLVIIDGLGLDRLLHVHAGVTATVKGMTFANGHAPDGEDDEDPGDPGGSVLNFGSLTVEEVVIRDGQAGDGGIGYPVPGGSDA